MKDKCLILFPTQQFDTSHLKTIGVFDVIILHYSNFFENVCCSKWVFLKSSLELYEKELKHSNHFDVSSVEVDENAFEKYIHTTLSKYTQIYFINTNNLLINHQILKLYKKNENKSDPTKNRINLITDSNYFLLTNNDIKECNLKTFDSFYRKYRGKFQYLMHNNKPIGGKWSFDSENQESAKNYVKFDNVLKIKTNLKIWLKYSSDISSHKKDKVLPFTYAKHPYATDRKTAIEVLKKFIHKRLSNFGKYQDYYDKNNYQLNHSMISMLVNVGLLTPKLVIEKAIEYAVKNKIKLNNIEGFVRQLFWREYMNYIYVKENGEFEIIGDNNDNSYWCSASKLNLSPNYFENKENISKKMWYGNTGIEPLDHAIGVTCDIGYVHHIGRLMIIGSFFLMYGIKYTEMYEWFKSMYVDAYDWVMYGNVFSMLYGDGGKYMSRPYFSSHNYLTKMTNFDKSNWIEKWDSYYHNFLITKKKQLLKQYFVSRWVKFADKDLAKKAIKI